MAHYHPEDPYEDYCDVECSKCSETKEGFSTAGDRLLNLLKNLYTPGEFDKEDFEDNLKDLCDTLEINFPKDKLQISGK